MVRIARPGAQEGHDFVAPIDDALLLPRAGNDLAEHAGLGFRRPEREDAKQQRAKERMIFLRRMCVAAQ